MSGAGSSLGWRGECLFATVVVAECVSEEWVPVIQFAVYPFVWLGHSVVVDRDGVVKLAPQLWHLHAKTPNWLTTAISRAFSPANEDLLLCKLCERSAKRKAWPLSCRIRGRNA